MIYKCIELFDLLPTTPLYKWAIAADWIQEEQDSEITSNAFRERIFVLEVVEVRNNTTDGDGDGWSNGDGTGEGSGDGDGWSDGHGGGDGEGYGTGEGSGNGNGCGRW